MTSVIPHAPYAEDQKYPKTILTFHVLRSGAAAGAIVSVPIALGVTFFRGPRTLSNLNRILFISSSRGLIWGTLGSGVALGLRMQGREDIEWNDRSWRLLANKGQVEVDNWILGGAAIGATAAILAGRSGRLPAGLENRMGNAFF